MSKEIIVLEVSKPNGSDLNVHWLFWLYPVSGREVPLPVQHNNDGSVSATPIYSIWRGASTADQAALGSGTTIEEEYSAQYPAGSTKAQIQADLVSKYNARAAQLASQQNPNQFYGVFFDSATGWSA